MAVRGEEVAQKFEAFVRESVDRMVADIRSTIQDVREAVDQQLDAALQSVQADASAPSLHSEIEKLLSDIDLAAPAVAAEPAAPSGSEVKTAVQNIERGKTQVDVLNGLLEQVLRFGSRAALLILKGNGFSGWKGAGFTANGGSDEQIKRFNTDAGAIPQLQQLLAAEKSVKWDGANLTQALNASRPERAILVPMVIKDKIAAALYVDVMAGSDRNFDVDSIELLVFTTGLLVDTLGIRKKTPSPSLSEASGSTAAATPTTASPQPPAASPQSEPTVTLPPPRPAPPPPPTTAQVRPPEDLEGSGKRVAPPQVRPSTQVQPPAPAAPRPE
ncbi:MAG: hypothetical protein WBX15_01820, partial [Thermoanaerobaculia bacterium]